MTNSLGQVISFCQEKGGSGKSTMLRMLASILEKHNSELKIAILDLDPQLSSFRWAEKSAEKYNLKIEFAKIPADEQEKIGPTIKGLRKQYDIILVDTAGIESQAAFFVVLNSDVVFMPSKANDDDLRGMIKTHKKVRQVSEDSGKNVKSYAVLFDVDENTNITNQVIQVIRQYKIPCLDKRVAHRTGIKEFTTNGGHPKGTALKEAKELLGCLQKEGLLDYYNNQMAGA